MKKLSLIVSSLCLTCSMSFGQILQWTKTIDAPFQGAVLDVKSMSKTTSSVATILTWYNNNVYREQLIWFGSKGSVMHNELLNLDISEHDLYGISSSRLVLVSKGEISSYLTYTRKGSVVTKTEVALGFEASGASYPDETGFFAVEKGEGDTWIIKRYIF